MLLLLIILLQYQVVDLRGLQTILNNMDTLTREYFDSTIKDTVKGLTTHLDQQLDQRLNKQSEEIIKELKSFVKEENEELARMVAEGFEDITRRLDFTERIVKLEREFSELKQALRV